MTVIGIEPTLTRLGISRIIRYATRPNICFEFYRNVIYVHSDINKQTSAKIYIAKQISVKIQLCIKIHGINTTTGIVIKNKVNKNPIATLSSILLDFFHFLKSHLRPSFIKVA